MHNKRLISLREVDDLAKNVTSRIHEHYANLTSPVERTLRVFGIPRGGISAALAILAADRHLPSLTPLTLTSTVEDADVIVDDLVDSGNTLSRYSARKPTAYTDALITKGTEGWPLGEWLVFPWEVTDKADDSATDIVTRLLQYIGEDPTRGGLLETPQRFLKAWKEYASGYAVDVDALLKTFEDGAARYDEMVTELNIPFFSHCEHHLAPFFGTVSFGYIPRGRVVGLSKMNRLVEAFARRLQVQERMTTDILEAFTRVIQPRGAGIRVTASHMCVACRGVRHVGCETVTTGFTGVIKSDASARNEFLLITQPRLR